MKVTGTISQKGVKGTISQLGVNGTIAQKGVKGTIVQSAFDWLVYWSTRYPSALLLTVDSSEQITLNWTNNGTLTASDSILIYESTDNVTFTLINTALYSASSYVRTGLSASTLYYYKIRYTRGGTYSAYCTVASATTDSAYEAETAALIARAATAPSAALAALIDTTIKGLKDDGVFALGDCLYVRGVHESQLACQNWIKNAHNSTLVNSPTFTPKVGFTGDGATSYINNNYTPLSDADKFTLADATIALMSPTIGTVNIKIILGTNSSTYSDRQYIFFYTTSNERVYLNSSTFVNPFNITNGAYDTWVRTDGKVQGYVNGVATGTNANSPMDSGLSAHPMYELAANAGGAAGGHYNGYLAFTFYGGKLTGTQVTALYNRIKYFYDNIGGTF